MIIFLGVSYPEQEIFLGVLTIITLFFFYMTQRSIKKTNKKIEEILFNDCDAEMYTKIYEQMLQEKLFKLYKVDILVNLALGQFFQGEKNIALRTLERVNIEKESMRVKFLYYFILANCCLEFKEQSDFKNILNEVAEIGVSKKFTVEKKVFLKTLSILNSYFILNENSIELFEEGINNASSNLVRMIFSFYLIQIMIELGDFTEIELNKNNIIDNGNNLFYVKELSK